MKYVILLLIPLLFACSGKYKDLEDIDMYHKTSYLDGKLVLTDQLTQNVVNKSLGNKKVLVRLASKKEGPNFLFSTTTDSEGYFSFPNLQTKGNYVISYEETVDGKRYFGEKETKVPCDSCLIEAKLSMDKQTGMVISITDSEDKPISNVDVCISISDIPFNTGTCEGSNYTLKTDALGHISVFNILPAKYYVQAKTTINNTAFLIKEIITVTSNMVSENVLKLVAKPSSKTLTISLLDPDGEIVTNGQVCLYKSKILFDRDTCEASNYSSITNFKGISSIPSIENGVYYILGNLYVNGTHLVAKDTVLIDDKARIKILKMKLK